MPDYDYLILGQGIAGTTLAWQLMQRGARVLVVDRDDANTPSRLAAGLITPITGKRLAINHRWDEFWPAAQSFYRQIESLTGATFLLEKPAVRIFKNLAEREVYEQRLTDPEFRQLVNTRLQAFDAELINAPHGGFEMLAAARLKAASYLEASRHAFQSRGAFQSASVAIDSEVRFETDRAVIEKLGVTVGRVIACLGPATSAILAGEAWTVPQRFAPAKGEMLTIHAPGLNETRVLHCSIWLVPISNSRFLLGATYDNDRIDTNPTAEGRRELITKAESLLRVPFEVIDHSAAVRPALSNREPVARILTKQPRLGVFNGLGSKGSLCAPLLAHQFAESL